MEEELCPNFRPIRGALGRLNHWKPDFEEHSNENFHDFAKQLGGVSKFLEMAVSQLVPTHSNGVRYAQISIKLLQSLEVQFWFNEAH